MTEWEGLLRIGLAALLGGLIGLERETLDKPAGMRTHMLVSMGAAMFMVIGFLIVADLAPPEGTVSRLDPTRIGSTIVTGIGFLGAGVIFRSENRVIGLTTAAGLWMVAAIGMASGSGYYISAVGGTLLTLVVLVVVRRVERLREFRRVQEARVALDGGDDL